MSKKFKKQRANQTKQAKASTLQPSAINALSPLSIPEVKEAVPVAAPAPETAKTTAPKALNSRARRRMAQAKEQIAEFTRLFGKEACDRIAPSDRAAFFATLKKNAAAGGVQMAPDAVLRQMINNRDLYRRVGENLIRTYPASFDFRVMRAPLAIGVHGELTKNHPNIPPEFISRFLSWITSRECYLGMIRRGVTRRHLNGEPAEIIPQSQRDGAALRLQKMKKYRKKPASFRSFRYLYKKLPRTLPAA